MARKIQRLSLSAVLIVVVTADAAAAQHACLHEKLTASDGKHNDCFGWGLALCGPVAAVGAFGANDQGYFTGAVYILEHDGAGWAERARIVAPDAAQSDYFGVSVAMSPGLLVAGAPGAFPSDEPGKVHVFRNYDGQWLHEHTLIGSQAGPSARFGRSVAVQGTRIVVGSAEDYYVADTGKAYVFEVDPDNPDEGWKEVAVLRASDGAGKDRFGTAVAISGDCVIVGAPQHGNSDAGAGYVFRRTPDGEWVEEAKFPASTGSQAGSAVAISGNLAVMGRPGGSKGRIDMYRYDGTAWVFEHFITSGSNRFGWSVACEGDIVVAGGRSDMDYGGKHVARVYRRQGGAWVLTDGLRTDWPPVANEFSRTLAMDGNVVLVGAYRDGTDPFNQPGAAYVFGLNGCSYCPADFNIDGGVNSLDVLAFLTAYVAGEPTADFNGDGTVNTLDVLAFLGAWSAGCE